MRSSGVRSFPIYSTSWKKYFYLRLNHGYSSDHAQTGNFNRKLHYCKMEKTGKVLLASDASERGSFLHTMASNNSQLTFDDLDGPVAVLGARNWIVPAAELEDSFFPQTSWIIDTIHQRILPLPGHQVSTIQTNGEILKRNRLGI